MNKKISVIVPVYNVEKELERCLNSIINQTQKNLEILLIDDGSTDNSSTICDNFLKKDDRIRYFRKINGGLSDARNFGFEKCIGEYVLFLDSDDYIEVDAIEKLSHEIITNDLDIICANALKITGDRKEKLIRLQKASEEIMSGEEHLAFMIKNEQYSPTVWKNLYRTEFLKNHQANFVKGLLHEDNNWTPKILLAAKRVKFIDYCFYNYVIREGSITTQKKDLTKNIADYLWSYEDLEKHFLSNASKINPRNLKIFRDYLASHYLYSICLDANYVKKYKSTINRRFLLRNARKPATVIKTIFFVISPALFAKIKNRL